MSVNRLRSPEAKCSGSRAAFTGHRVHCTSQFVCLHSSHGGESADLDNQTAVGQMGGWGEVGSPLELSSAVSEG